VEDVNIMREVEKIMMKFNFFIKMNFWMYLIVLQKYQKSLPALAVWVSPNGQSARGGCCAQAGGP
jgi:hypothetical protein